jgi:hypothetical protein
MYVLLGMHAVQRRKYPNREEYPHGDELWHNLTRLFYMFYFRSLDVEND